MRHEILANGGAQDVLHVPRDRLGRAGRVSSANFQIVDLSESEDSDDRVIQSSTAATVDSTSTTVATNAAGPGSGDARVITVADESGFVVGHTYQIVEDSVSETFVVSGTSTGELRSVHELRNDYSVGSAVRGIELSGEFPAAEADDEDEVEDGGGPYAVIWDYTLDGRDYLALEEIYIVRYSLQSPITESDVMRAWPLANELARERFSVQHAIASATEDFYARLEASGLKPDLFRHSTIARVACRDLAISYLHRWRNEPDEAVVLLERYDRLMNDFTVGQHPERTVKIDQATNTSDRDGDKSYGTPRFRIG